ncbi:metallophosphoesterase family protein [Paracoccaceae bacterium GXU_MW_L88]
MAVLGDIHGRYSLFKSLIEKMTSLDGWQDVQVVLLGDLVDRGSRSRDVIDLAMTSGHIALKGNHEEMMLDFLNGISRRWLEHGGAETLESFGLTLSATPEDLHAALGEERLAWLNTMPTSYLNGNILLAHAGGDPGAPPDDQPEEALLWGVRGGPTARKDGVFVVHGHYARRSAKRSAGILNLDSGAAYGGPLSAALIAEGHLEIIEAGP